MKNIIFSSVLADRLSDFVACRRAGGADYSTSARYLLYFDRFLCKACFNGAWPTRDVLEEYVASTSHLHPNTRVLRVSIVRQFCQYLHQFEPQRVVPEQMLPKAQVSSRVPHIFSEGEMKILLRAALELLPVGSLRPKTFHTLFGVLLTTGLRIGEAMALDMADVETDRQLLYVHKSKFRKSRWVPMSASTSLAIERYVRERIHVAPPGPDSPLFVNLRGHRLVHQVADKAFRQTLSQCGLRGGKGCPGPRMHDMRHSYACNRLLAWYREGKDVNALLSVLSTYLGHADYTYTQVYLRATAELLEQANERFLKNFHQNIIKKGTLS